MPDQRCTVGIDMRFRQRGWKAGIGQMSRNAGGVLTGT
jgi:hypothetical protein